MKKLMWLVLLALVFGLLATGIVYSQTAEENNIELQYAVKELSPDELRDLFDNWGKDKVKSVSTVNVSGDWCFTKETTSIEEKKGRIKVTMRLEQGSDDQVKGALQTFYYEDGEWKTGRQIIIEGIVANNMLSGDLLDGTGQNLGKHKFVFSGNDCRGVLNTGETNIFEIEAIRCGAR